MMADETPEPKTEITLKLVFTDDSLSTSLGFDLSGLPDESLPFMHALMEGLLLLLKDPSDIAQVALDARETAAAWSEVVEGMHALPDGEETQVTGSNVVRLH